MHKDLFSRSARLPLVSLALKKKVLLYPSSNITSIQIYLHLGVPTQSKRESDAPKYVKVIMVESFPSR
jgi:hypothetical protein